MEALIQRHLSAAGTDIDLRAQLVLYEVGSGLGHRGPTGSQKRGGRGHRLPVPTLPWLLTSGPMSARVPCGWRMETSRKPPQVGGGSVESPLQRKARGAADL